MGWVLQGVSPAGSASVAAMKTAVVLMAYGSPERLEDVPAYYADIRGGRPIASHHLDDLVDRYRRLGIERSNPLNAITEQTRASLEAELGIPVFTGMKHWTPHISEAAARALESGAELVVGLVLAPHYSRLSIAGYKGQLERALVGRDAKGCGGCERLVRCTIGETGCAGPVQRRGRDGDRNTGKGGMRVGEPREQLFETARLVAAEAEIDDWSFSFQSESPTGEPWLGPDILDHLAALDAEGTTDVLVCPVGFVSDHLEIRWDIDREAKERAAELGLRLERIEMPNADPRFVEVLAEIVRGALAPVAASR